MGLPCSVIPESPKPRLENLGFGVYPRMTLVRCTTPTWNTRATPCMVCGKLTPPYYSITETDTNTLYHNPRYIFPQLFPGRYTRQSRTNLYVTALRKLIVGVSRAQLQNGCTPLHFASGRGHVEVSRLLIKEAMSYDINARENVFGDTPLMW